MDWSQENAQQRFIQAAHWTTPILSDQRVLKALKDAAQQAQAEAWKPSKSDRAFLKQLRIAAD